MKTNKKDYVKKTIEVNEALYRDFRAKVVAAGKTVKEEMENFFHRYISGFDKK